MDDSLMVCATYLPPKITTVIIQNQTESTASVIFNEIFPQKFKRLPKKSTRKVKEVRRFNKGGSVFRDYKIETEEVL